MCYVNRFWLVFDSLNFRWTTRRESKVWFSTEMVWCVSTGKSSTRYAQIDISATETAHKVGTQHALGRQEGLHTLELRRKGTPRWRTHNGYFIRLQSLQEPWPGRTLCSVTSAENIFHWWCCHRFTHDEIPENALLSHACRLRFASKSSLGVELHQLGLAWAQEQHFKVSELRHTFMTAEGWCASPELNNWPE